MGDLLKQITDKWYGAAIAAGVAIIAAGAAVQHGALIAFGAGLVLIGVGEFVNHPYVQIPTVVDGFGRVVQAVEGHPRRNNFGGVLFVVAGTVLLAIGCVRLALL